MGCCSRPGWWKKIQAQANRADDAAAWMALIIIAVPPWSALTHRSMRAPYTRRNLQGEENRPTVRSCSVEVFRWLTFYNTRRRHSALGHLSPAEYEQDHLCWEPPHSNRCPRSGWNPGSVLLQVCGRPTRFDPEEADVRLAGGYRSEVHRIWAGQGHDLQSVPKPCVCRPPQSGERLTVGYLSPVDGLGAQVEALASCT